MGPVGVQEMIVIFLVALVLFGPKKLPELGRTVARALHEFRKAQNEFKATLQQHMSELERENESVKEITRSFTSNISNSWYDSYNYDSRSYGSDTHSYSSQPVIEASISGASATQGAEAQSSQAALPAGESITQSVNGTVPRKAESFQPEHGGESHPIAEPNPVKS